MTTRYDEGTYKSQLEQAKDNSINFSIVLIRRLMLDIDTYSDIEFAMKRNEKPELCKRISELLN